MRYLPLLGRFFYSAIFILSGLNHFRADTVAYAASAGVPLPAVLVPLAGIFAVLGGAEAFFGGFKGTMFTKTKSKRRRNWKPGCLYGSKITTRKRLTDR